MASLDRAVEEVPTSVLPVGTRKHLASYLRKLDEIGRIQGATVYLDARALRDALSAALSSPAVERVLGLAGQARQFEVLDGPRERLPGRPASFLELLRAAGAHPGSAAALGLTPSSTPQEVEEALRRQLPELPHGVFEPELAAALRANLEGPDVTRTGQAAPAAALGRYGSWMDCMMQNGVLPASLVLIGLIFGIGVLAALASGGTLSPFLVYMFFICFGGGALSLLGALSTCSNWQRL